MIQGIISTIRPGHLPPLMILYNPTLSRILVNEATFKLSIDLSVGRAPGIFNYETEITTVLGVELTPGAVWVLAFIPQPSMHAHDRHQLSSAQLIIEPRILHARGWNLSRSPVSSTCQLSRPE